MKQMGHQWDNNNNNNIKMKKQKLESAYYNVKDPASFSRPAVLAKSTNIPLSFVKKWLKSQPTHTLHRSARIRYPTRKYIVSKVDEQWQSDLCDMQLLSKYNNGYKYILTVIDVLSRYGWALPLKNKKGESVAKAFEHIFDKLRHHRPPDRIQTDQGKEFENKHVRDLFKKYNNIELFSIKSPFKASIVERWNRTLKGLLYKYFTAKNTLNWINVLQDFVKNYNHRVHRTIKMRPVDVNEMNAMDVWETIHGATTSAGRRRRRNDIQIGDRVRISKVKSIFKKGYLPNWTEEEFFVHDINKKYTPTTYKLADYEGNIIEGSFYRYEIQPVEREDEIFIIDKVLKQKKENGKKWFLVHSRGYPKSMDSWVPAEMMISLRPTTQRRRRQMSSFRKF